MDTDLQIVKSNHIIEASYRLSVAEQRVILSAISQVRRDRPVTDEVLYSVSAAELSELCGTDPKTAYRDLQDAAERLQTRRVTLTLEPDGKTIRTKRRSTIVWVQRIDYVDQEGRVELRFGKDILPYLTGLQREFTRYALSDVARMTSAYGIRLYELIVQWRGGKREIELADLRRWLQLEDRYPSIKDFKVRVLDPAVEQINKHSPMLLTWNQRKTGRKVTHIVFEYSDKSTKRAAAMARKKKALTDDEISLKARPGESWEAARARLAAS
jgi:plasmid replication initiation protein